MKQGRILVGIRRVVDLQRSHPTSLGWERCLHGWCQMTINPFDEIAREEALRFRERAVPTKSSPR